jgi:phosphomannomutase
MTDRLRTMNFTDSVFKAYDIRGLSGVELTPELAYAVGKAVADYLPQAGPVIVGRDMRADSEELHAQIIRGLTEQGRDVWDIGLVPTDMVYFGAGHFSEVSGGVMVTASHNPGKYNGIKLCGKRAVPMGATNGLLEIKEIVKSDAFKPSEHQGEVTQRSILDEWIEQILNFSNTDKLKPYRVAADAGNGMAGAVLPALSKKLPLEITPLYYELDGTFPNHVANPHLRETLSEIIKHIQTQKLDFGMAFDGDGDRGVLIDETGAAVSEAILGAILAKHYLDKNPGSTVIYDVRTSHIVRDTIEKAGGKGIRSKVGGDVIKHLMREHEAILGIELSGHYYFRDNYYSDSGLLAVMSVVGIMAESGQKLSELVAPYVVYATADEQNLEVSDADEAIARIKESFKDGKQDELDGLTVEYADWWFNVRKSNTEPVIRLNVEARNATRLQEAQARLESVLSS